MKLTIKSFNAVGILKVSGAIVVAVLCRLMSFGRWTPQPLVTSAGSVPVLEVRDADPS